MRHLVRKPPLPTPVYSWREKDIPYLVQQCHAAGYTVSPADAEWAWGEYCEDCYCASWLDPHTWEPEHLLDALLTYLEPAPEAP